MWWRRSSAWCCRARPTRCPTAMPAPSAGSARSPSAVGTTELEHVLATQVLATRRPQAHAHPARRHARRSRRRQGRGAAHHRRDRRRRRPRPCGRICRRGGAGDDDREPADAVQSRHRDGRAHPASSPPTTPPSPGSRAALRAAGRVVGPGARRLAEHSRAIPMRIRPATSPSIAGSSSRRSPGAPIRAR